ncbi:MotA/TolQ/ExbB proton channel family protein [Gemmata sp. JC673]|uniref:MotA/TolQ/ExbB proton channel family protein n=1 Tax=Gemmata algarum TaxID=2975278 RepID=A0ABU5EXR1_9BACT|nr:MotA/TolQ/ExbB proton channel family protein [Gemmata algarum]MDY3559392.1 MotA/TolQ/ExbB proton channel family protein [Gemmata algarum]
MVLISPRLRSAGRFLCAAALALVVVATCAQLAQAQDAPTPASGKEQTGSGLIVFMLESLGIVFGLPLLLISLAMLALVVLLFLDLRMSSAIPPGFVDEFTDIVNKRKFKEAFDMARNDPSFLGQVLTAGMSRLQYGLEDAREAAMNTLESIKSDKEMKNNYNSVIATVGPMLGLVGTVWGMIRSFSVLATATQVNPSELAKGISHALVVTLFGVAISVPAIFFNAFYRNRITRVTMDVGHIADDLLTQMYHNSKKAAAAPPTTPAPANGAPPTAR